MIGIRNDHNDVYVFFEKGEVKTLETKTLQGVYINQERGEENGVLECRVSDSLPLGSQAEADLTRPEGTLRMDVELLRSVYERLVERHSVELHQGFRHIHLADMEYLMEDGDYGPSYEYLKTLIPPNPD